MAQSGYGKILLFNDFAGPEIPVTTAVAYGTTGGGCNYYLGDFTVRGTLEDTAGGVVSLAKTGGWVRIGGQDENAEGVYVGTEVCLSPALNGTLACEARVELRIITTTSVFVGFHAATSGVIANATAEPITSTGTTMTLTATEIAGFIFDSQLTAKEWHMPYQGGSLAAATDSSNVNSGILPTAAESVVLRVEIDSNGTCRWYIDGVLKQTKVNAVDPNELLSAGVGSWGTTTTATDIDCDYLAVEGNRDWTA
jgi:hypothetical protein|tara:strand:- start:53 stop:811 length:759 start_codon:yes stop_codon:yes gene_type:complete